MKILRRTLNSVFLFLFFAHQVYAQSDTIDLNTEVKTREEIIDSRIKFIVGWFLPNITSTAQLNSSTGRIGATINLERTFRLPENRELFRLQGLWRLNNASSFDAYYYALNRSGSSVSKDSLQFGSIVINIGAEIDSRFNMSLFGGRYHYSIVNDENFESGFSAGISFLDIDIGARIEINNSTVEESYDGLLFLPVIGFFNRVNFWDNFAFRNHINLFALDIDRYNGTLFDFAISLDYTFIKYFAVGFAYDVFSLDVNFETGESGKIQYSQRGVLFFATLKL